MIQKEANRVSEQRKFVRAHLADQMMLKANLRIDQYHKDREGDLYNLRLAHNIYANEERARLEKTVKEKEANKANWES